MALQALHVLPVDDNVIELYRVVTTADTKADQFVDCFKSSDELGIPPRSGSPEERFCLIHNGVSMFETAQQAAKVAIKWGKGDYVARVRLEPGHGICVAKWGSQGHMTVWGDPVKLAGMTVDTVAVSEI